MILDRDPKDIFNAYELGVFYQCIPSKCSTFQNEKCTGRKNSKQRVTLLSNRSKYGQVG